MGCLVQPSSHTGQGARPQSSVHLSSKLPPPPTLTSMSLTQVRHQGVIVLGDQRAQWTHYPQTWKHFVCAKQHGRKREGGGCRGDQGQLACMSVPSSGESSAHGFT